MQMTTAADQRCRYTALLLLLHMYILFCLACLLRDVIIVLIKHPASFVAH